MRINAVQLIEIRNIALLLLSFFPILPFAAISILTALFFVLSIYTGFEKKKFTKERNFIFLRDTAYFILLCISLVYSSNKSVGVDFIFRMCPLIIFPFISIYLTEGIDKSLLKKMKTCFMTATFTALFIIFYYAYLELRIVGYDKLFYWSTFARAVTAVAFLDFHPTYISLYIAVAIYLFFEHQKVVLWFKILIILILVTFVVLLSSRGVFWAMIISSIVALIFFIKDNKTKIIVSLAISFGSIYIVNTSNFLKTNLDIKEIIRDNYEITSQKPTSNEIRIVILNCFYQELKNDYILGLGIGDLKGALNNCYKESKNHFMKDMNFNTHNNYLFFWGTAGVFCVILFVFNDYKYDN